MKDGSKSKMESGSKDLCGDSTGKKNNAKTNNKDITFIVLQKNMRSRHSSERIEEMVCEFEGYRWDAILLSETWRQGKSEVWETHHKHMFMGAGKYDNKHGVGIMLNKKWRQRNVDTEYINERAITATIVVNRQRIKLMSAKNCTQQSRNTLPARIAYRLLEETSMLRWDHNIEKMYKTIEKHTTSMQNWDLVTEPNA